MSRVVNPNKIGLCVRLAGNDHQAGVLLYGTVHWIKYAEAAIPKVPGKWIANNHEFWRREAQLSRDQLSRNLKYLADRGLIQRRQWWWGGSKILFVRPTPKTLEFLAAATTWPAADELLQELENHTTEISKVAEPGPANLLHSGLSEAAQPALADLLISNNIKTEHTNHEGLTSGSSAVPTYPGKKNFAHAGSDSGDVSSAEFFEEAGGHAPEFVMSLADAATSWTTSVKSHSPGKETVALTSKQKGAIALIVQNFGQIEGPQGPVNFQLNTADILEFGIRYWTKFNFKNPNPDPEMFCSVLGDIINGWTKAGGPPSTA